MSDKRTIEIFTAGCACCDEAIEVVDGLVCPSCEVRILDMRDGDVASRARELGIRSVPAVVVDGALAGCCANRGADAGALRSAGVGLPLA
ncbi:MAG TPA: hypothetical protein VMN78_12495 [Longimicrobiales bacterium]|nr:hypothetical protein [Longimicrobiales bacterium]